ncbi:SusC/RagA family TonB-linked outer membrane protein [Nafulsella turpanensis]|uniref:SusC/RagA family TonB-linked outer membrane protein n=1 Tax=Nafulsella turpanensis TaxID=1265690 RepID=UPI00059153AC|nr:TonB-dependent receptor [Nafulsella turpanensis]
MKRLLLICLLLAWLLPDAVAQRQVSGKVIEASTGEPLPGVTVLVKGTSIGVTTDLDGSYRLEVPGPEASLVFSFVGYHTQEVVVGNKSTINVTLEEDVQQLEEVVVVGYGTLKKSDLTGSVSSVTGEDLRSTVTANIDQALQGRVAGVQVSQNSGAPGAAVSIKIRGTNSITGSNEPLYVIDGIQVSGDGGRGAGFDWAGGAGGQQENSVSPLSALSPSDIESIEILKDASATAIYGSRAANGVVIITTKRGKEGEARVSYNGYYAVQSFPEERRIDVMTLPQYAEYNNQLAEQFTTINQNERFMDPSLLGPGTDWQDEVFQIAPMQSHQLSITGGSEKSRYAVMGGYFQQDGIIIGSGFDRFNIRTNLDSEVKSWLNVGTSLSYSSTDEVITLNDGGDGVIAQALSMPPQVSVRNMAGDFGGPAENESAQVSVNPVALALLRSNTLERQRIMANFYADAELTDGLSFRTEIGFDDNTGVSNSFVPENWEALRTDVSQLQQRRDNSFYWIWKNYFTYSRDFGVHSLTAMVGNEAMRSEYEGSALYKINLATNDIITPNQGDNSEIATGGWAGANSLASYYGRFNYNYSDRYLATVTLRADGSSRFGPNNRWGYFPSVGLAWRVANEDFMPESNVLTDLKLRVGYGEVGNQEIPNYAFGSALTGINTWAGLGYINARLGNPDLKWETTAQYNVGVDIALWTGRVDLTIDAYQKFTRDLLLQVSLPNYLGGGAGGIGAPYANVGRLENKGLEIGLHTINVVEEGFSWKTDVNFTLNRNEITEVDRAYTRGLYWYAGFDEVTRTTAGGPVGLFYGYQTDGIFTTLEEIAEHAVQVPGPEGGNLIHERDGVYIGDVKFKDISGPDGVPDGIIDSYDKTVIGDPNPDFSFGLNNTFTYGAFDFSFFLSGAYGADIFNFQRYRIEGMISAYDNQSVTVVDRARYEENEAGEVVLLNPETDMPRFSQLNVNENNRMSDRWIEDGSFLRIQNVSLAYTLPGEITQRFKVHRLRVYANAQNLYTFTNYTGLDPEIGAFEQDPLRQNIDMGRFPSARVFTFGVNIDL